MALFKSHIPPPFQTSAPVPSSYSYGEHKLSSKLSKRSRVTNTQLLSCAVLIVVLLFQFLRPPTFIYHTPPQVTLLSGSQPSIPPLPGVCVNNKFFFESFPVTREHKMSLLKEAQRVAAEFDYPAKELNRGVKEFMREMGMMGLGHRRSQYIY